MNQSNGFTEPFYRIAHVCTKVKVQFTQFFIKLVLATLDFIQRTFCSFARLHYFISEFGVTQKK
jgi:hypothetical protein